jgi:hypothetical protein
VGGLNDVDFERRVACAMCDLKHWWLSEYYDGNTPAFMVKRYEPEVLQEARTRLKLPMKPPSVCIPTGKDGWVFEGLFCYGFLLGFTILVNPTPGIAINLGPLTLLFWRNADPPGNPNPWPQ